MRSRAMRRLLLSLLGLAVLGGGIATVAASAPAANKPGLTLQLAPASQSITRGQVANYTITVTPTGGFAGSVTLAASGLPSGSSATFTPGSLAFSSAASQSSTLAVTTTSSTPTGSFSFSVTGSSGKIDGSAGAGLTVNAALSSSLGLTSSPASVTMNPGGSAVYALTIARAQVVGPVSLAVSNSLPSGATAAFTPNATTGTSSTLQIDTKSSTPNGTYTLNLVASGTGVDNGKVYAYASVSLVISSQGKSFALAGNVSGLLAPGVAQPLNLELTNPNNQSLSITNLTVTVKSVAKAAGAPAGACTTSDYAVTQYSGPYPLSISKNATTDLFTLVTDRTKWPQVRMLDTAVNQDGCKGATVTLVYSGSGSGN